jgi:purine-cytosine permease-like protein
MWERLLRAWPRNPVWSSHESLATSDLTAAIAVAVIGLPALVIGADILGPSGLGVEQMILAAPLGAVAGGFLIAVVARIGAITGAGGVWLFRPAFGTLPSMMVSLVRLGVTAAWGALVLRWTGAWFVEAMANVGFELSLWVPVAVLGAVALLGALAGPLSLVKAVIRRYFFWATILAVVAAAFWIIDLPAGGDQPSGSQGFISGIDLILALTLIWTPYATDLAPFAHREDEAANSLGFGFAAAALLAVVGGALLTDRLGGFPSDLSVVADGWLGAAVAVAWLLAAHLDDGFGLSVSSTGSLMGLVPGIPGTFLAPLATVISVSGALLLDSQLLREIADLSIMGLAAAVGILLADFYVVRRRDYRPDDLFRWRGGYRWFGLLGLLIWLLVMLAVGWLHPLGPQQVRGFLDALPGGDVAGVPPTILALGLGFITYGGFGFMATERVRTFSLRGSL